MKLCKQVLYTSLLLSTLAKADSLASSISDDEFLYHEAFQNDGLANNAVKGGGMASVGVGGASWIEVDGKVVYDNNGTNENNRAVLYSQNSFQSNSGFVLNVKYRTGSIGDDGSHNLSFGLISDDTDLSNFDGFNPFKVESSVYSIGTNLTTDGTDGRGFIYSNGESVSVLDQSGTQRQFFINSDRQFVTDEFTEVTIEIGEGGAWCYRINGEYAGSGAVAENFDLSKNYKLVVYGQDDNGGGKEIESITLERNYAQGERAAHLRGSWQAGQSDASSMDQAGVRTVGSTYVRFNDGATTSAQHRPPILIMDVIASGNSSVGGEPINNPNISSWGDITSNEPTINDRILAQILEIHSLGFGVEVYSNSENFIGSNANASQPFVDRWMEWCDTDPVAQAFINSQPYHTGVWNRTLQQYVPSNNANRRYHFCYAEFILKELSLRYGKYITAWSFDSAVDIRNAGDNFSSGIIEEQRIFQAFANAIRAGNPDIPVAFNNGRSTVAFNSYPFAAATRLDDFTFGHAFGGNGDHAGGNQFNLNLRHVTRMEETNGYVHAGAAGFDNLVVGNFHSKLGPISWQFSTPSAWETDDFVDWNVRALAAGGHMTWEGSVPRNPVIETELRNWAVDLIKAADTGIALQSFPDHPRWVRNHTLLPDAQAGRPYRHVLIAGDNNITNANVDFWDPEGDSFTSVTPVSSGFLSNFPTWLTIEQDPANPNQWILSGTPTADDDTSFDFAIEVTDTNGFTGTRNVEIAVNLNKTLINFENDFVTDAGSAQEAYSQPDENNFDTGVRFSSISLTEANANQFSRFADIGGGSIEAAIADQAGSETISYTVDIDSNTTANFATISFDTSYFSTNDGATNLDWTFSTIIHGITTNVTTGGFTHDGELNYQSPESGSGNIALTGLTGLSNTRVTFVWEFRGSRGNNFANQAIGLDNIEIIGSSVPSAQAIPEIQEEVTGLLYHFDDNSNVIDGQNADAIYSQPDENTFGSGVSASPFVMSEADSQNYSRFASIGGSSAEAAVVDRAGSETLSFTVNVDAETVVDFNNIAFSTAYFSTNAANTSMDWTFSTVVDGVTSNETTGGFNHNGETDYQAPTDAARNISLTGLTDLSDTSVTFIWEFTGGRGNNFSNQVMGLDNVLLTGSSQSTIYNLWATDQGLDGAELDFNADTDGDGIPTLLEFVLDGNPNTDDSLQILPKIVNTVDATTFSFNRRVDSTAFTTQTIQYSFDLETWFDIPANQAESMISVLSDQQNNDIEQVSLDLNLLEQGDRRIFTRLLVE